MSKSRTPPVEPVPHCPRAGLQATAAISILETRRRQDNKRMRRTPHNATRRNRAVVTIHFPLKYIISQLNNVYLPSRRQATWHERVPVVQGRYRSPGHKRPPYKVHRRPRKPWRWHRLTALWHARWPEVVRVLERLIRQAMSQERVVCTIRVSVLPSKFQPSRQNGSE